MAKKEEKAKVGRPKLADPELIKDSWFKVGACLVVALVMVVCGAGVLTGRSPWQILTFQNPSKVQGNVASAENTKIMDVKSLNNTKIIKAKKVTKKIIGTNGKVTYVIPAKEVKVINVRQ